MKKPDNASGSFMKNIVRRNLDTFLGDSVPDLATLGGSSYITNQKSKYKQI